MKSLRKPVISCQAFTKNLFQIRVPSLTYCNNLNKIIIIKSNVCFFYSSFKETSLFCCVLFNKAAYLD